MGRGSDLSRDCMKTEGAKEPEILGKNRKIRRKPAPSERKGEFQGKYPLYMTSKREIHLAIRSLATRGKTLSVGHGGEVTD